MHKDAAYVIIRRSDELGQTYHKAMIVQMIKAETHGIAHQYTLPLQLLVRQQLSGLAQLSLPKKSITLFSILQYIVVIPPINQLLQRRHNPGWRDQFFSNGGKSLGD